MKNLALLILISCIFHFTTISQSCLPEGIRFGSQEQINNFPNDYPNCTKIEGTVSFDGEDIINVNALQNITAIEGNLFIDGFTNRTPNITSLQGFRNLETIGGSLRISQTLTLSDFTGLEKLTSIGGDLLIGAIGLKSTNSTAGNCGLTSLAGLHNLCSVGGGIGIVYNKSLESLKGLEGLTTVGGDIIVDLNYRLKNLNALHNLTRVEGDIEITRNHSLENINGITNIEPESIHKLRIGSNPSLTFCEADFICRYLSDFDGEVSILNNAMGCNNKAEVMKACDSELINDPEQDGNSFCAYPNPFNTSTTIKLGIDELTAFQVIIFNYMGEQIMVKEFEPITGNQEIIWNANELPSGIYFCRLKVGNRIQSMKMTKK